MTEARKRLRGRQAGLTDEFKAEAVRLALSGGRPLRAVAEDLGIGYSTLGTWITAHRDAELRSGPHADVSKELARLRRENEILRQERDFLKKAAVFFAKETHK
jgi:transposase